jgi:primosomal replication protein N
VPGAGESRNTLILDATIAQRDPLRYTPAGIPAVDCTLQHTSTQAEAGGERKVECELFAVAFGEPLSRCPGWRSAASFAAKAFWRGATGPASPSPCT